MIYQRGDLVEEDNCCRRKYVSLYFNFIHDIATESLENIKVSLLAAMTQVAENRREAVPYQKRPIICLFRKSD